MATMHRPSSSPRAPRKRASTILSVLALLVACGPDQPADPGETAADVPGDGLVILVDEDAGASDASLDAGPVRPYYHDFGRVPDGEVVSHVFRLENRDPNPVAILAVKPGCGCTLSRVRTTDAEGNLVRGAPKSVQGKPLVTVLPGRVAEVELQIDTRILSSKNVDKTLTTLVTTDSPNSYYITLETHIFAAKPFHIVPNGLNFGRVPLAGEGVKSCDVVRAPGFDVVLGELLSAPPGIRTEISPDPDAPRPLWRVTAFFTPEVEGPLGRWTGRLLFQVLRPDGTEAKPLEIPLQADRSPDLVPDPLRLVFVADEDGAAGEVVLSSLLPGHLFGVRDLRVTDPELAPLFETSFEPAGSVRDGRSGSWTLRLRVQHAGDVREIVRGELLATLDDPQHESVRVVFVVHPGA